MKELDRRGHSANPRTVATESERRLSARLSHHQGPAAVSPHIRRTREPAQSSSLSALSDPLAPALANAYRYELRRGLRVLLFVACAIVPLAGFVPLSGAVVTTGRLISASNVKKVQHPAGGILTAIMVEDGTHVERGAVVARLDAKQATANLIMLAEELAEARMRVARLAAERDGSPEPEWPDGEIAGVTASTVEAMEGTQDALFKSRDQRRKNEVALLGKELDELGNQVIGLRSELEAKSEQAKMVTVELAGLEQLYAKELVTLNRVTVQRRDASSLKGDVQQISAQIKQAEAKIGATRLQIARARQTFTGDVLKDLAEAEQKQLELTQQHAAALEILKRVEIRSPQTGTVHELAVHTVGGVVAPGEVLMLIEPAGDDLVIEARLQPKDIDQISLGQPAIVRMTAFDRSTTPQLHGTVTFVSPDSTREPQTGASLYTARISLSAQAGTEDRLRLVAGMPAEVFLETGSRSAASYLFKPLTDQLSRMFRDR